MEKKVVVLFFVMLLASSVNVNFGQTWKEKIKIASSDRAEYDNFGNSVCISGNYAIVGAQMEDDDSNGDNPMSEAGSVYILKNENGSWMEFKKITAPDRAVGDRFGYSVAVSGDYIVVGAYCEDHDENDSNTMSDAGSVYIFKKDQGGTDNWGFVKKLTASDRAAWDNFGCSVSIYGSYIVVGAMSEEEDSNGGNTISAAGSAYIFNKDEGGADNWGQIKKLTSSDREVSDRFGISVSIDGDYILIGANCEGYNPGMGLVMYGAAYIFKKDFGGPNNWGELKKVTASQRYDGDYFGYSVSISAEYAVIGAYGNGYDSNEINYLEGAGSAYILKKDFGGQDNWGVIKKITASDRNTRDYFGYSGSISGDFIVIGANEEDQDSDGGNTLSNSGSVYVFYKDEGGADNWGETKKITSSDRGASDKFGGSVSISGRNFISSSLNDYEDANNANSLAQAGSVYLFIYGTPPTSSDGTITINEDENYAFRQSDFTFNDTDGDTFAGIQIIETVERGELKYDGANTTPLMNCPDITKLVYKPESNSFGTDYASFKLKVIDSEGELSLLSHICKINVNEVNTPPFLAVNSGGSVDEGGTFTFSDICLKGVDEDSPTYSLLYNITTAPQYGKIYLGTDETSAFTQNDISNGKVIYIHDGSDSNEDFFNFIISDSDGNTSEEGTFAITIIGVNDPPVFTGLPSFTINEDESFSIAINSLYSFVDDPDDPDSLLTFSLSKTCENITLIHQEGCCNICGVENWFGTTELKLTVSDSSTTIDTTFSLTVLPVNDLPTINGLPTSLSLINGDVETIDLNGQAEDVETPDNLLVWSFSVTPDSVYVNYNEAEKIVSCSAKGSFNGAVELIVTVTDEDGGSASETINITVTLHPTGTEKLNGLPTEYTLCQNYPNPFNPTTTIRYSIPVVDANFTFTTNVSLKVFDILGNEVATLVNEEKSPGYYEYHWNAGNLTSGIYFSKLQAGKFSEVKKLILMK